MCVCVNANNSCEWICVNSSSILKVQIGDDPIRKTENAIRNVSLQNKNKNKYIVGVQWQIALAMNRKKTKNASEMYFLNIDYSLPIGRRVINAANEVLECEFWSSGFKHEQINCMIVEFQ